MTDGEIAFNADVAKWKVLAERITYARQIGAQEVAIWSAGALDNRAYWDELRAGPFK